MHEKFQGLTMDKKADLLHLWLRKNKKTLLFLLIGILIVCLGGRYLEQQRATKLEHASIIYDQLQEAFSESQFDSVQENATQLKTYYHRTPYAGLAALFSASAYLQTQQDEKAIQTLQWIIAHGGVGWIKETARIRLARIYASQKRWTQATATLAVVEDPAYAELITAMSEKIKQEKTFSGDKK